MLVLLKKRTAPVTVHSFQKGHSGYKKKKRGSGYGGAKGGRKDRLRGGSGYDEPLRIRGW